MTKMNRITVRGRAGWVLAILLGTAASVVASEPWADPRLTLTNGLELWFDATRQNVGRAALELGPLVSGQPVDYLADASGNKRHLAQPIPDQRPRHRQESAGAFLRFDGTNDCLSALLLRAGWTNVTVFITAAPRGNAGFFRAFLSCSQAGRNDYTSGLNLDLGPAGTPQLSFLNAEGAGCPGVADLWRGPALPFGVWHNFTLTSKPGTGGVRLLLDGEPRGTRDRNPGLLRCDSFVLGARHYSNGADPPFTQGFFQGDIAEVLLYGRELEDSERQTVEKYLADKHAAQLALPPAATDGSHPLVAVTNPPPIQVLLPGFEVRALPIALPNINNVKYRPDGKLVAAGYNGKVYLLSDTDGDGLEDRVQEFWGQDSVRSPIGLALTPPGYPRGQGVFLPAKGKLSLIVDTNGDDQADEEIVAATWTEKSEQQGVDALGVALDKDGNIYFGLGAASFTGAYLIDQATGRSRYRLESERGTILKLAPDFSRRETVCTGIRFSVALAFNREGDLFCTDQEGATWLPNGNPLDELLHIQPGRHYGFPPRHPKHLPAVIDEPSVFDYAPQHESTCGLNFNELPPGSAPGAGSAPCFGPAEWQGDAIVSGYSRGKLYRTKLVKTALGYVAQNQLVACLQALTVDACVSPRGELVVATHSGQPDWGSGPNGQGKLYQIRYVGAVDPRPVLAWPASPTEIRIAFDRPLDPARLRNLGQQTRLTLGRQVYAGDRFETVRPGYQVIYDQLTAPRLDLPVLSTSLSPDRRTLTLNTPAHPTAVNCAITLPSAIVGGTAVAAATNNATSGGADARPMHPDMDLLTDLTGVEAQWVAADRSTNWTGWLPHLDLAVARALTRSSADHDVFWKHVETPGTLTLRGQLDLWHMLQPNVQPGASLDYVPPAEEVRVRVSANAPGRAHFGAASEQALEAATAPGAVEHNTVGAENRWLPFEIRLQTGKTPLELQPSWTTSVDPQTPRPFPVRRFLMPWAVPGEPAAPPASSKAVPELAGGRWLHGREVFFSDTAACGKCHRIHGEGGEVGPDLSNLIHRDYASVLKDIRDPSSAINPDHLAYNVELTDGEAITAVLKTDGPAQMMFADATGRAVVVAKKQIRSIRPSAVSLMPEGLLPALPADDVRDLLTFLLTAALEPAPLEATGPPPPRTRADLEAFRPAVTPRGSNATAVVKPAAAGNLQIVLCAGPKDHGPGEHDYPLWQRRWTTLLRLSDQVTVTTAERWPNADQLARAQVIVFYSNNPDWNPATARDLDAFLQRGGGAVFLHFAVDGQKNPDELAQRIGLAWRGGASKFRHGPLELKFHPHPLGAGFKNLGLIDESYWQLVGDPSRVEVLAGGVEEDAERPLIWTRTQGQGRIFVSIPGHYTWTFDDPLFRLLILRGICWAGHQPIDRLAPLATVGARMAGDGGQGP
jgi:putative heme-binding domain-containing protein